MRISILSLAGIMVACAAHGSDFASEGDGGRAPATEAGGGFGGGGADAAPRPGGKTIVYAHTDTTLYQLDAENMSAAPVLVGDFDCVGAGKATAMTDIAVAKDGSLFGVSEVAAYPLKIDAGAVHCQAHWPLPNNAKFYGLTVAPEGTVDAIEVLIGANSAGELYRIDATSGATTQVGTLGVDSQGNPYALSGDIVFLANGGSPVGFATVRTCSPARPGKALVCSTVDTLVEVDVKAVRPGTQSALKSTRGAVKKGAWCKNAGSPTEFGSMFGIAAFQDKVFGFSRKGDVVEIHNDDGTGCSVGSYPLEHFAGAGVTTSAPVVPPTR